MVVRDNDSQIVGKIPIADDEILQQFGEDYLIEEAKIRLKDQETNHGSPSRSKLHQEKAYSEPLIRLLRVDNNAKPIDCTALIYWVPYVFDRSAFKPTTNSDFGSEIWSMITMDRREQYKPSNISRNDTLSLLTNDAVLYLPKAIVLGSSRGPQSDWMTPFLLNVYQQVLQPKMLGLEVPGATQNTRLVSLCRSVFLRWYFGNMNGESRARKRTSEASNGLKETFRLSNSQHTKKLQGIWNCKQYLKF